jgi:hypothetical protein
MRKVIQKEIVKVVQPEIVEYICDDCGAVCGTKENPMEKYYSQNRGRYIHLCKGGCK